MFDTCANSHSNYHVILRISDRGASFTPTTYNCKVRCAMAACLGDHSNSYRIFQYYMEFSCRVECWYTCTLVLIVEKSAVAGPRPIKMEDSILLIGRSQTGKALRLPFSVI